MSVCLPARVIRRFIACHAVCLFVVVARIARIPVVIAITDFGYRA
jgi:hypothetical protein